MSNKQKEEQDAIVDDLYAEAEYWHVNTGGEAIHAKRISGKWRTLKWLAAMFWLLFFLGPYLRLGDRQAVLFDISNRQFHIFGVTILPQDFWMLALLLLFFAILLAVATMLVGRVYCGFFCFQTIWIDIYTWIEDRLEGNPQKRRRLDKAPWDLRKFSIKLVKHALWLIIAFLTGMGFVAWFVDVFDLWRDVLHFQVGTTVTFTILLFVGGTYGLAGFLREQACFWLCPYARIQGVMIDRTTVVPTYDFNRGEPRGRLVKGEVNSELADCVDCNQCVAVCPTGVDIRYGQQEGCIMCALCIDACDIVMDKTNRPRGLIRYESLDALEGREVLPLFKRPRMWVYSAILLLSFVGIGYGLNTLDAIELKVLHARQPLFVLQSDGSLQNRYTLKVLNKMTEDMDVLITVSGPEGLILVGADDLLTLRKGKVTPMTVFIRVPRQNLHGESVLVLFRVEGKGADGQIFSSQRESFFIGPEHRHVGDS